MDKKKCCSCLEDLPLDKFSWKNKIKNILQNKCKECHKAYAKNHYVNNKSAYFTRAKRDRHKEYEKNRELLAELKKDGCVVCREKRIPTLDFHHLDPNEKDENIARLHSRAKIIEEVKKCVVLCKNCHSIEHHLLRQGLTQL